jgi:nucleotide-binding universal stress UspA family protein
MSFSFFLPLLTYPDRTSTAGLGSAIAFAAKLGGSLTVSSHVVDIPPISNPLARGVLDVSSLAAAAEAGSRESASLLSDEAHRRANELHLPVMMDTFRVRPEALGEYLAIAGRSHDLVLLSIAPDAGGQREAAEALLFGSGGPVVLFPEAASSMHLRNVAIGWDGGRAAARAVRDALPVLRTAQSVTILTEAEEKDIAPASVATLLGYLEGHGIATERRRIRAGSRPVGDVLQEEAVAGDAGLLVMGAYGHNRLREFVLGGATRSVLTRLRLPTLMSH